MVIQGVTAQVTPKKVYQLPKFAKFGFSKSPAPNSSSRQSQDNISYREPQQMNLALQIKPHFSENSKQKDLEIVASSQTQRSRNTVVQTPNIKQLKSQQRGLRQSFDEKVNKVDVVKKQFLAQHTAPKISVPKLKQKQIVINTFNTEYPLIDEVAINDMGWRVSKDPDATKGDFDLWWSDLGIDNTFLSQLKNYQKVNHFPAMFHIARKSLLAKNLKRLQKIYPNDFDYFPRTWCLPQELNELKSAQEQAYRALQIGEDIKQKRKNQLFQKHPVGFTMIVKPDQLSQGKGIFLTNEIEKIDVKELSVVQEYLNTPYLIDGLKFDIRIYVLVLSCDPLEIFVHKEGIVRFATQDYQPLDLFSDKSQYSNMFMHLTNYALNKENAQFRQATSVEDDQGHKRTITSLMKRLQQDNKETDKIEEQIHDLIIKTIISIQQELVHTYRMAQSSTDCEQRVCFELLGFDVILDSQLKPVLLEVNHAPSFATDSPLDYQVKKKLFIDMFQLIGLTIERKKQKIAFNFQDKIQRLYTRLTKDQKNEKLQKLSEELAKNYEQAEAQAGGFTRILPIPLTPTQIQINEAEAAQNHELVKKLSLTLINLQKRQEHYDEMLRLAHQQEYSVNVRQLLRIEEQKKLQAEQLKKQQSKAEKMYNKRKATQQKLNQSKRSETEFSPQMQREVSLSKLFNIQEQEEQESSIINVSTLDRIKQDFLPTMSMSNNQLGEQKYHTKFDLNQEEIQLPNINHTVVKSQLEPQFTTITPDDSFELFKGQAKYQRVQARSSIPSSLQSAVMKPQMNQRYYVNIFEQIGKCQQSPFGPNINQSEHYQMMMHKQVAQTPEVLKSEDRVRGAIFNKAMQKRQSAETEASPVLRKGQHNMRHSPGTSLTNIGLQNFYNPKNMAQQLNLFNCNVTIINNNYYTGASKISSFFKTQK